MSRLSKQTPRGLFLLFKNILFNKTGLMTRPWCPTDLRPQLNFFSFTHIDVQMVLIPPVHEPVHIVS